MAQRKPYNPNTAYGRKKMREEHELWKNNLPPEEREQMEENNKFWGCLIAVIIIIIVVIIGILTGNEKGALRWLSH